jgi:hypothetical protein
MFSTQFRLFPPGPRCKHCRVRLRQRQFTADFCSRACRETWEYMQVYRPDLAQLGRFRDAVLFVRLVREHRGTLQTADAPHTVKDGRASNW